MGKGMALNPPGIGVPDWPPPFQYAMAYWQEQVRIFLPAIEAHYTDEEAWHLQFTDSQRLSHFKVVHGNRKGPIPKRKFDVKPSPGLCPHRLPMESCALPECAQRRGLEASQMSKCRSCQAPIVWAATEAKEGKPSRPIALDAEPMGGWDAPTKHDNGNLVPVGSQVGKYGGSEMIVRYVPAGPGNYRAHFASCPNAKEHRR